MDGLNPWVRMGRHGRLLDASVLEALLCPGGVHSEAALRWLQQVGAAPLAVSGASVLRFEARLRSEQARPDDPLGPHDPLGPLDCHDPGSVWALLDAFLAQRCSMRYASAVDVESVRWRLRFRPELGAPSPLLELELAYRQGLLPVSCDRQVVALARQVGYPVEVPPLLLPRTNSCWGWASLNPSWR